MWKSELETFFSYVLQSLILKMSFFEDECFVLYAEKMHHQLLRKIVPSFSIIEN